MDGTSLPPSPERQLSSFWLKAGACNLVISLHLFQGSDLLRAFHGLFHGSSKCCLSNKHSHSSQIPSQSQRSWKTRKASSCCLPWQILTHPSSNPVNFGVCPRTPQETSSRSCLTSSMTNRPPCLPSLLLLQSGQHIASKGDAPHFNPPCPMLLLANYRTTQRGFTASRPVQGSRRKVLKGNFLGLTQEQLGLNLWAWGRVRLSTLHFKVDLSYIKWLEVSDCWRGTSSGSSAAYTESPSSSVQVWLPQLSQLCFLDSSGHVLALPGMLLHPVSSW